MLQCARRIAWHRGQDEPRGDPRAQRRVVTRYLKRPLQVAARASVVAADQECLAHRAAEGRCLRVLPVRRPAGPVAVSTLSTMVVAAIFGVITGELDPIPHFPSHLWLILVGITSVAAALTLLPALLSLIGDRVNSLRVPFIGRNIGSGGEARFWGGVVRAVMRHPGVYLVTCSALLIALAIPALGLNLGASGVTTLPNRLESKKG